MTARQKTAAILVAVAAVAVVYKSKNTKSARRLTIFGRNLLSSAHPPSVRLSGRPL
jgi:hypothetical protein